MAERQSPLAALKHPGQQNSALRLSRVAPGAIIQVTAWPESQSAVQSRISEVTGVAVAPLGQAGVGANATVISLAPGRSLVACQAQTAARLHRALPSAEAAFTDIGHGRAILRLAGAGADDVLAKGVAIDLDMSVFPVGRAAATAIHHIDVTLHRREAQVWDVWVLRGFAQDMAEWLIDAGLEFGIGLEPN